MRAFLRSPRVRVLAAVVLAIALWNIYVELNDDGILEGRVVYPDGAPARGASVTASSPKMVGLDDIATVTSDDAGRFRFTNHNEHRPVLQARLGGFGRSERFMVRLYFRNQNRVLADPLVLRPE